MAVEKRIVDGKPPRAGDEEVVITPSADVEEKLEELEEDYWDCPDELSEKSDQILRGFFNKNLEYLFGKIDISGVREQFLEFFPNYISVYPTRDYVAIGRKKSLNYRFIQNVTLSQSNALLENIFGAGVKDFDLYSNQDLGTNLKELVCSIPDLRPIYDILRNNNDRINNRGYKYMVTMYMPVEYRPLITVALDGREDDYDLLLVKRWTNRDTILKSCVPSFAEISSVAKEYGITDIVPVLDILKESIDRFERNWYGKND